MITASTTDDLRIVFDNLDIDLKWLKKFPPCRGQDIYKTISKGKSYDDGRLSINTAITVRDIEGVIRMHSSILSKKYIIA